MQTVSVTYSVVVQTETVVGTEIVTVWTYDTYSWALDDQTETVVAIVIQVSTTTTETAQVTTVQTYVDSE